MRKVLAVKARQPRLYKPIRRAFTPHARAVVQDTVETHESWISKYGKKAICEWNFENLPFAERQKVFEWLCSNQCPRDWRKDDMGNDGLCIFAPYIKRLLLTNLPIQADLNCYFLHALLDPQMR